MKLIIGLCIGLTGCAGVSEPKYQVMEHEQYKFYGNYLAQFEACYESGRLEADLFDKVQHNLNIVLSVAKIDRDRLLKI
jgi:hypothetical protein